MFWNILRMERDKILRRRLLWIGIIIIMLPIVAYYVSLFAFRHSLPGDSANFISWPAGLIVALNFATGYSAGTSYGVYLAIVVIGVVTAQEFSWRTMQLWLAQGVSRPLLLAAKLALSLVVLFCIVLACLLLGSVLSLIFGLLLHGSVSFTQVNWWQLLLSYLRVIYAMLPYAALTFMLAIISRSSILAVGGGLLFATAIEIPLSLVLPLLGTNFAHIAQFLPVALSQDLNSQNYALAGLSTVQSSAQFSPLMAATCIAIYTLVLCGIALIVFRRQDLSSQ